MSIWSTWQTPICFFDFAQGIKITCMVDCCFQHGMDGHWSHRTPVISYFTFYGIKSMYFFFRTLNVQLSEAEWRRQRSCTARWAWDIHAEASSKLQLSWVLESSPKLSKKFWKKAEFTVGFSCDSVCWRSYFGFSCDCCHRFGKSFSIYIYIRINKWSFTKLDPLFCMNQTIASECVSWFWGHCPSPRSGRGQQQSKDVIETEVLAAGEHTQDVAVLHKHRDYRNPIGKDNTQQQRSLQTRDSMRLWPSEGQMKISSDCFMEMMLL